MQKRLAFGVLIVLALLFGALTGGNFLNIDNLLTIILPVTPYAILGFGLTFVLITGGTDPSTGSVLGFSGIVCASALPMGLPMWLAIIAGIVAGGLAGLINDLAVTKLNVTPFIATLGTQFAFHGLTRLVGDGKPVSVQSLDDKNLIAAFKFIGGGSLGPIPFPTVLMIVMGVVLGVVLGVILEKTGFGHRIYAIGSNQESARLSGVNTNSSATPVRLRSLLCGGHLNRD